MRKFHVVFTALALLGATVGNAFTLDLTKLPTQQGFTYIADGNRSSLAETSIFSVSGGALHQKLTGNAYGGPGYVVYSMANADPDSDFVVEAKAQITAEEATANVSPYGLSFGVATNYGYAMLGIAKDRWAIYNKPAVAFNGMDVHTYRMTGHKATKTLDLSIDGVDVLTGFALPQVNSNLGYFFADATGYTNTDAVLLGYTTSPVPEPATGLLAFGVLPFLRRRKKA